MTILIIVLLGVQYFILFVLVVVDEMSMVEGERVMTSKERWFTFAVPFAIYVKGVRILIKFCLTLPDKWKALPEKSDKDMWS